ncbi:ABC-three component system middle component 6 [Aminipila sp.]|uniref:ABC-three component system middle component 6 n=1 Tax=Aminipila sp. TaxID=2060095 RepID=UPI00289D8F8A|nr:ABC-three component system middle component 6 [Aminipila sp.]
MDIYKINKFQAKYENPIYVGKLLHGLLNKPMIIDSLFQKFEKTTGEVISWEYEQILLLSLCFMYSIGMIENVDNKIRRCEK